jgi:transcriptional regulator with XRE-family HTH domain
MYGALMESESAETGTDRRVIANLRTARERAGLTQKELAEKMQASGWVTFHQQTVTRYEGGRRTLSVGEVQALADVLGTSILAVMRPEELARESWLIRDAIRVLLDTRDQIRALRLRQSNARLQLERRVQAARDAGTADRIADAIASAEHVLKQEDQ